MTTMMTPQGVLLVVVVVEGAVVGPACYQHSLATMTMTATEAPACHSIRNKVTMQIPMLQRNDGSHTVMVAVPACHQ